MTPRLRASGLKQRHPPMREIEITTPNVLKNLKTNKAPGQDSISPRVLRELADIIAPMLNMVDKKSYDQILPSTNRVVGG